MANSSESEVLFSESFPVRSGSCWSKLATVVPCPLIFATGRSWRKAHAQDISQDISGSKKTQSERMKCTTQCIIQYTIKTQSTHKAWCSSSCLKSQSSTHLSLYTMYVNVCILCRRVPLTLFRGISEQCRTHSGKWQQKLLHSQSCNSKVFWPMEK